MENIEKKQKLTNALLVVALVLLGVIIILLLKCCPCNAKGIEEAPVTNNTEVVDRTVKVYNYTNPTLGFVYIYPQGWGPVTTTTTPCPGGGVVVTGNSGGVHFGGASDPCDVVVAPPTPGSGTDIVTGTPGHDTPTGTGSPTGGTKPTDTGTVITTDSGDVGHVVQDPRSPSGSKVVFETGDRDYPQIVFWADKTISAAQFNEVIKSVDIK